MRTVGARSAGTLANLERLEALDGDGHDLERRHACGRRRAGAQIVDEARETASLASATTWTPSSPLSTQPLTLCSAASTINERPKADALNDAGDPKPTARRAARLSAANIAAAPRDPDLR